MAKLLVALLFACMLTTCGAEASDPAPSNVLLIVIDTLRKDHLGCYGYGGDTSPNIDRLAGDSTRFERAISQAPWTLPSIGALLTSQYPSALGIRKFQSILHPSFRRLPEVLREHGYTTGAIVSHSFCSSEWNFDQGFDLFDESSIRGHAGICSPSVTAKAFEFLEQHQDEPFFLFLHYFDAHFVYRDHAQSERGDYKGIVQQGVTFRELDESSLTAEDIEELVRLYDGEIRFTDAHIGRVIDRLVELGLYEDCLIVLTADHGEEFHDHGAIGHSQTLYRELVDVPLLIRFPGAEPGVLLGPVASVDVYPTILNNLGIQPPAGLSGKVLTHRESPARAVFSEATRGQDLTAISSRRFKIIKNRRNGQATYYDLENDPGEQDPLRDPSAELVELEAALDQWIAAGKAADAPEILLSPNQLERLKALGYVAED